MALIIAGDRSGVGKTTVTLAILAYLAARSKRVQSFKVGPDYIDPMFHRAVTGLPCRNLDPVLTSPRYIQDCFQRHVQNADWVVIEGVMGLFDGIAHPDQTESLNDYGSTAHIARILNLPVALVLDCSSLSTSIAAIASGYSNLDPDVTIAGVLLNQVASDRHLELLETALNSINMPILGVFRRNAALNIPDRHLGLVPSAEISTINQTFNQLAELAKTSFNWNKLFPLVENQQLTTNNQYAKRYTTRAQCPLGQPTTNNQYAKRYTTRAQCPLGQLTTNNQYAKRYTTRVQCAKAYAERYPLGLALRRPLGQPTRVRIAIARDKAFNFYYQDNLDILAELGVELVFWSPLKDQDIPDQIQGLYFGGGFPEMFAQELSDNKNVIRQLQESIQTGIPTYAECGGLMYLCKQLIDLQKQAWSMVGIIPSTVTMQGKLTLGYRTAIALQDSSLIPVEKTVRGHEFHRSQLTVNSDNPQWQLQGLHKCSLPLTEGWNIKQLHASYLHLHWGAATYLPERFIQNCRNYKI